MTTYRAIAQALGDEMASRAVGQVVAEAEQDESWPTHRVIRSDGRVGSEDAATIRQLSDDGIRVRDGRVVGFRGRLFEAFETDHPLRRLQTTQDELVAQVERASSVGRIETVAGVDLSYRDPWHGVGAYVQMDPNGAHVCAARTAERAINFPYIPTYLAFRELPVLLALLKVARDADQMADVVLVDGTGLLHHRHAGIASHLGVLMNVPTVGVTKKLLYGDVDIEGMATHEARWVTDPERSDHRLGAAVKTTQRAHPIYVSTGHRVDLDTAVELVLRTSSRKLPEPIRRADQLSREATRQPTAKSDGQQPLDL